MGCLQTQEKLWEPDLHAYTYHAGFDKLPGTPACYIPGAYQGA
jgi:hypothetical protein